MPAPQPAPMKRRWNSTTSSTPQAAGRAWKPRCSAHRCERSSTKNMQRWPEFVEAAQRAGIRASLSVPLLIAGMDNEQELVGSLNIYSHTATAFDSFDAELMRLYSVAAGQAISNSSRWQKSRETVTQLETALHFSLRHRHGQRRSHRVARLRSARGVRQTRGRIPKAQHQTARHRPRNADRMQTTAYSQRY